MNLLHMRTLARALIGFPVALGSIIAGYAPGWKSMDGVDLSKYTHINLAYAEPLANGSITFEASYKVNEIVDQIHRAGSQVLIALGGYSGSVYISDILKTAESRAQMIKSIANFIWDNHVDGVDIDWVSHECNKVDVQNDAANLLVFLRELRESLNSAGRFSERKLLVALGVGMQPFSDTQGPLSDVSEYSKYVDYINILAYDINGPDGNTTGPNSPLNYELNRGSQYSLISAIDSWTSAKFPINQITAGIAFYGRSFKSIVDMSNQSWNEYQPAEGNVPRGDDDDGLWADRCTGKPPSFSGIWSYRNLRKQGVLKTPEAAAAPWLRNWDSISLTPWVFNTNSKIFISYDDPWSVSAKANYVLERGLGGVTVYDVTMDYNDELLGAVKRIIGSKTTHENTVPVTESSTSSAETSTLEASATQSPPFESQGSSETVLAPIASSTDAASSDSSSSTPQATSTIPAIVSTSTAADLTLTTTSIDNDVPRVGDSCGWQPVYKCVAKDGKDAIFLTCVGGAWIQQQCATGTACVQNGNYIYCDWPR